MGACGQKDKRTRLVLVESYRWGAGMASTKYIVSNKGALEGKYLDETPIVEAAFTGIIAADRFAGITTTVLFLDDVAAMTAIGAPPVMHAGNPQEVKAAIDGIFSAVRPTYMTIFGAPDVVPHQALDNPKGGDGDKDVPSDLPYASSAPFSSRITDFLAPSRVITRLPDLDGTPTTGPKSASYPLRVLANAANRTQGKVADYENYFAVSAQTWRDSTTSSVTNVFGNVTSLYMSPPDGPAWRANQLAGLSFFVNAHGGNQSPKFRGQLGASYPECLSSAGIHGKVSTNAVFSVEACYGAQLYNPNAANTDMAIVNQVLMDGCCGYLGSSTISYGPATGQGQADIICQEFLRMILAGRTVGQAGLEARQNFIRSQDMTSPSNLKTIGQFLVIADCGFAPVVPPVPLFSDVVNLEGTDLSTENERRALELQAATDHSEPAPDHAVPQFVAEAVARIAEQRQFSNYTVTPHRVVFNDTHAHLYADLDVHVYDVVETVDRPGLSTPGFISVEITASQNDILRISETSSK